MNTAGRGIIEKCFGGGSLERVQYFIGDVVKMKKLHPCGSDLWEITRTGMDFGIKCKGCGRFVMLPRPKFEKAVKRIEERKATLEESEQ